MDRTTSHAVTAGVVAAGFAAACACATALAAQPDARRADTFYSESIGVTTPGEHITGSTSSRDAQGAPLQDEQALLDKVVGALVADSALKGANIHVEVEKARVVLTGRAKDRAQADHARDVARDAASGAEVESKLAAG